MLTRLSLTCAVLALCATSALHGQAFLPLANTEARVSGVSAEHAARLAANRLALSMFRAQLSVLDEQNAGALSAEEQARRSVTMSTLVQVIEALESQTALSHCEELRQAGETARADRAALKKKIREAERAEKPDQKCNRLSQKAAGGSKVPKNSLTSLWPVGNAEGAKCYWESEGADILEQLTLSGTENRGALNVSLVTEFIGPFRTAVDGVLAATTQAAGETPDDQEEDDEAKAVTRFLSGGGNAVVSGVLPIFQFAVGQRRKSQVVFSGHFWPRFGVDVPALGTEREDVTFSSDLGIDFRVVAAGEERKFGLLVQARPAWVIGTDEFYRGIGYDDRHSFGYVQMSAGFIITDKVLFAWSFPLAAPDAIRPFFRNIVSISISR